MTQLALIPPTPHLDLGITNMHLLLAHLCKNLQYLQFYRKRSIQGDHLILDNSAYEFADSQASMAKMMALGYYIQVDELVVPDAIMDEQMTYGHTLEAVEFMSTAAGQHSWKRAGSPRLMVVPQVNPETQGIDSYDRHARLILDTWHSVAPYLSGHITLGVSKNMNNLHGGWTFLFREVISDLIKEYPIQVHCLGCPKKLVQVRRVLKENPYIRSLDTALPFVSALHGVSMQSPDEAFPRRPAGYLDMEMTEEQIQLAGTNIGFLLSYFVLPAQPVFSREPTPKEAHQFEVRK